MSLPRKFIDLYMLLDGPRRARFLVLLLVAFVAGVLESFALASLAPVMSASSSEVMDFGLPLIAELKYQEIVLLMLGAFFLRTVALVFLSFYLGVVIFDVQATISERLFYRYITTPNTSQRNISELAKNVITESQAITQHGYVPVLAIGTDVLIAIILLTFVSVISNGYFLIFGVTVALFLVVFSSAVRNILNAFGKTRKEMDAFRYQYVDEAFQQRDLLFSHKLTDYFFARFKSVNRLSAKVGGRQSGLNMATRWVIEGFVVLLIGAVLIRESGSIFALADLAVAAAVGFRLLQISSKVTANLQRLDFSDSVLKELKEDLRLPLDSNKPDDPVLVHDSDRPGVTSLVFADCRLTVTSGGTAYFDKLLDFELVGGELVGVVGKNGAGKSTFSRILIGAVDWQMHTGSIRYECKGSGLKNSLDSVAFSYVPQEPVFLDTTILENLTFGNSIDAEFLARMLTDFDLSAAIDQLPLGLDTPMGDKFGYFSGGQRQRLAIIRALVRSSNVLIMDEPTAALDLKATEGLIPVIRKYAGGRIVLVISHDRKILDQCDSVLAVEDRSICKYKDA